MKNTYKRLVVFVLLFCLTILNISNETLVSAVDANNIISGECGQNVYYELNCATGALRIYGTGAMDDFYYKSDLKGVGTSLDNEAPWIEQGYSSVITDVVIEEGVTYIGSCAFSDSKSYKTDVACDNIESVSIAKTVTEIGSNAFRKCEKIKSITIPDQAKIIGSYAFDKCLLSNIQLGKAVQKIGNSAFSSNDITDLYIPQSVEYIGQNAFADCSKLESVVVPDDCEVDYCAFGWCTSMKSASFGKNCTIHGKVFKYCSAITKIDIGQGSIGCGKQINQDDCGAFSYCTNLEMVSLPDSWELEDYSGEFPAYSNQFYRSNNITTIKLLSTNNKYKLVDYVVFSKDGNNLVYYPSGLTDAEYEIPENVTTVGVHAFEGQGSLQNIIIPSGVKIEGRAFQDCSKLNNVIIPEGVEELGARVFANCGSLKTIVLPKSLKSIDTNGKASTASFDGTNLDVVYSEKESYAAQWAGEKFKETKYCFFDANGGKVDTEKKVIIYNDKYRKLPVPTRSGYKFIGWYTQKEDGIQISSNDIVDNRESHKLYAHWEIDPSAKQSIIGVDITLETSTYTYDGTEKRPSVTVKDGSTLLEEGTDYTLSYSNNVNVGNARVTITGIGRYIGNVSVTFIIRNKTVEKKPFVWGTSNWSFDNSSKYFTNYNVNTDIMNKMKNDFNLTNSDIAELKWNISNGNKAGFGGSCFGMTISEIMAHQGDLKLSRYGGNDDVNKNQNTSNMISVINFIQELQSNSEMCQSIRQTPFLRGDYSQQEFIAKLSNVASDASYLVKLSYKIVTKNTNTGSISNGYHAVLVYGIEECNYYSSVTGKRYDKKILIADPNYLSGNILNDNACLYFNSSDSSWIVPYWNKKNTNGSVQSCYWNAENSVSTSNGGIRNIMRYASLKEEVDLMAEYNAGHYIAGLQINNISKNVSSVEKVKNSGNPNADYTGNFSDEIVRYDMDMADESYITENEELYALWNPTSSYTLSYVLPSDYNLKMDYENVDYYADVTNTTYTLFKPNGSIQIKGSDADYDIAMVTDETVGPTDWYSVSVSGKGVDDVIYTKVKNGYTLSASKLQNVKVSAEGENFDASTVFSTKYDKVFIYEINRDTIGVAVDTDNNGSYETTINTIEHQKQINKKQTATDDIKQKPIVGTLLKDKNNKVTYKVIESGKKVAFYRVDNKNATKITIPNSVTINKITYKVVKISNNALCGCKKIKAVNIGKNITVIGSKAFYNCKLLKKIIIPSNVIKIGKKAFYGCKRLKSITIKTKCLKSKFVGNQAFRGIHKKAVIKVPKKQRKLYVKLLKKKGIVGTAKIK